MKVKYISSIVFFCVCACVFFFWETVCFEDFDMHLSSPWLKISLGSVMGFWTVHQIGELINGIYIFDCCCCFYACWVSCPKNSHSLIRVSRSLPIRELSLRLFRRLNIVTLYMKHHGRRSSCLKPQLPRLANS